MSKGSKQRPSEVSRQEVEDNWEKTFGKKDKSKEESKQDCKDSDIKDNSEKN